MDWLWSGFSHLAQEDWFSSFSCLIPQTLSEFMSFTIHIFIPSDRQVIYCLILAWPTEKAMAPHSSTLAWKIPWMEEPGRLQSMGLLRVGHD